MKFIWIFTYFINLVPVYW